MIFFVPRLLRVVFGIATNGGTMIESNLMSKYRSGNHVKFEVVNEHSSESEWMWLLVETSDDEQELAFETVQAHILERKELT